jgi:hypothetical protein
VSRISTKVYAPDSKKIAVSMRGHVHPDVAIAAAREELEEVIETAQKALDAPLDAWRVVVSATDDAPNITEIGGRVAFLPDDEQPGASAAADVAA